MSWAYCAPKSTTRTVSGAWAAGVAEDTRCLPAVGRELVPPDSTGGSRPGRPPPSAPVGSCPSPSAPVSPSGPGWTRARGAAYLPPCSRTRPSSLPMATGPPAAMVVLLEPLSSDFPGAPGRQGPGRLRSSGPCRSGAPHLVQRGAPMTTTATPAAVPAAVPAASAAADGPAAVSPERTGARTAEAAELITGARERIDALDDRIIALVQERIAVSAVIQQERIASGGRRVNLSREMEVLAHYRDALGRPGTALAMTLLELCRGRI